MKTFAARLHGRHGPTNVKEIGTILRHLSFDDLREWAGGTILNRGKRYVKRVDQLSRTPENMLVAWVNGTKRYATSVRLDEQRDLEHFCTCPYEWGPCKHAVAVILTAAERVKRGETIPVLDKADALSLALHGATDEGEDWREDSEPGHAPTQRNTKAHTEVEKNLGTKSPEELLDLLTDLTRRFPEVRQRILETEQLASGQVDELVCTLQTEIDDLTAEPAWYNPWRGEGRQPDYSHLDERLQALVDRGHADAALELGEELWTKGNAQVEQSDDDGETAMAIAACLETVMAALPQSSLSPAEQLLWIIDWTLEDEYCLLDSADKVLQRRIYKQAHWREVAGSLEARLQALPKPSTATFSTSYRRERLLTQLLDAYGRAGWKDRIIPCLEDEADACQCYTRLADTLLAAGERDRARHWCVHGYARTIDDTPGIASDLQERLRKMAQTGRQYDLVAAYRAQDFFDRPSSMSFSELRKASDKAKCWPAVRTAILEYLETGKHPARAGQKRGNTAWPLPVPEVERPAAKKRGGYQRFPDLDTLIDIAILEKRLDDTVALYQRLCGSKRWHSETDKTVAQAVANSHPDVALDIWRDIVNGLISQVKPKAYEAAAVYLRLMEKVYRRNHRLVEWQALLTGLRQQHKAKRRLIGELDALSGKKIVN